MQQHEKRLTSRLIKYWKSLKRDYVLPEFGWFNRASVGDLWEYCFCLQVFRENGDPPSMSYVYFGPKLVEMLGKDLKGQPLELQTGHFPDLKLVSSLQDMLDKPREMSEEGEFVNFEQKHIKFRGCVLPFGHPGSGEVSHIVGCISWKSFDV
jgi:hypothetical protein